MTRFGDRTAKQMIDEQPPQQRHGKRFYQPVYTHRRGNAAPMAANLPDGRQVNFQQHRYDHEPDEDGDRQIDMCQCCRSKRVEQAWNDLAQPNSRDDAERDPER